MVDYKVLVGDVRETLRSLPNESVNCVVTSPPYWGLRDYGHDRQIGLEQTPDEYVAEMMAVFREVWRVLRGDGTLWLNLGDSYVATSVRGKNSAFSGNVGAHKGYQQGSMILGSKIVPNGLKPKDLMGIPWRVAFALQADGWYLRQDIIWQKPNPMPESVRDRCTKAHEYIFLLSKSQRYHFDHEAIQEPSANLGATKIRFGGNKYGDSDDPKHATKSGNTYTDTGKRNRRSVWSVATRPYKGAHFATFPPELIRPCILAGCPVDGTVLDPFAGSGTTLAVAIEEGRNGIGCELNPEYVELIHDRLAKTRHTLFGHNA